MPNIRTVRAGNRPHATNLPLPRLDSRSLGRPTHLLPRVAEELREALNQALHQHWNRRYQTSYDIVAARITPFDGGAEAPAPGRWLQTPEAREPLACLIERGLVLHMLAQRLGLTTVADAPAETATEDRLRHSLARSLAERCLRTLGQLAQAAEAPAPGAAPLQPLGAWVPVSLPRLPAGAWLLSLELCAPELEPTTIKLVIDGGVIDAVLRALAAALRGTRGIRKAGAMPSLGKRLPLLLKAQLLEQRLPLEAVLALKPGSLIPVHLEQATVRVEGAALFHAQVAEHQGQLCLTSFQDLE